MRFRPCIDIHNGKVKQIVGGSLRDEGDIAEENFVSELQAEDYARTYHRDGLSGGHIILLNPPSSPFYEKTLRQALEALKAAPGDFMAGGGINPGNTELFLKAGASHVIVTSYVFSGGVFHEDRLLEMVRAAGKEHLCLDLSCRKSKEGEDYLIVTDRWQNFTDVSLNEAVLSFLSGQADEFLIHAVDVEGKRSGIEIPLVRLIASFLEKNPFPVTYAGGVGSFEDLAALRREGKGLLDVTIGSALDLFGGSMSYREVLDYLKA